MSHSNFCEADVPRMNAAAAFANLMCPEWTPQRHLQVRCAQNERHTKICKSDVPRINATETFAILKSYINPYHGAWDPVGTFCNLTFSEVRRGGPGQVLNPVWYILESKLFTRPMPEWENAFAEQIVPTGRYWMNCAVRSSYELSECAVRSSYEHSECYQLVLISRSKKRWNQECHKRWLNTRSENRLTLRFTRKAEIVTHWLLKICPRL